MSSKLRCRVSMLLVWAAFTLSACATRAPAPPTAETVRSGAPTAMEPYAVQAGDVISIKFYYNPELNEDVLVRPDGMISLQLIGDIRAAGQSPGLLAAELTQRYTGELATPKINVIVRQLGGARVYVGGEVTRPGVIPLSGGLTLFQAVQEAGSFLKTAQLSQVVLIRRVGPSEATGYSIDVRPIANGASPGDDVALRPYDIVFVPRSKIADVNVFVEQYIRNVLPIQPGFGFVP